MTPTTTATPVTYGMDASFPRFSVARYQKMIEDGNITPDDQLELLEHYLVLRMPGNPPHDNTIQRLTRLLAKVLPDGWQLRVQLSVTFGDSQPRPDFAIARGDDQTYEARHPGPADLALVIEVAHSSLLRDRRDKARIYARAGVPCYWIVNLVDHWIEVYTQPSGPTVTPEFASITQHPKGDSVALILDGTTRATLPVSDIIR